MPDPTMTTLVLAVGSYVLTGVLSVMVVVHRDKSLVRKNYSSLSLVLGWPLVVAIFAILWVGDMCDRFFWWYTHR